MKSYLSFFFTDKTVFTLWRVSKESGHRADIFDNYAPSRFYNDLLSTDLIREGYTVLMHFFFIFHIQMVMSYLQHLTVLIFHSVFAFNEEDFNKRNMCITGTLEIGVFLFFCNNLCQLFFE